MTREDAERRIRAVFNNYFYFAGDREADEVIEALRQEPCGKDINVPATDAISRQAVLDGVDRYIYKSQSTGTQDDFYSFAELVVKQLPSVTPQPKTGHWEWVQYDYNPKLGNWHCSECRCVFLEFVEKNEKSNIPLYKYCPQCGAKMAESEDKK